MTRLRMDDAVTLHHTATHCNTLQHTATHCNALQHTATHCKKSLQMEDVVMWSLMCASSKKKRHTFLEEAHIFGRCTYFRKMHTWNAAM